MEYHPDNFGMEEPVLIAGKFQVFLGDSGRSSESHNYVTYKLELNGSTLFEGKDIGVPMGESIDSFNTLMQVIEWLTVGEGDTNDEFFQGMTEDQLDWCASGNSDRELLGLLSYDWERFRQEGGTDHKKFLAEYYGI